MFTSHNYSYQPVDPPEAMQRKDREAFLQKIAKLETELFDCRHHMGLLVKKNKEWTSKYEDMRETLAELQELLKLEKTTHLDSLSRFERREENFMKALDTEKKCVTDLKKALHETCAEFAQVKQSSEAKRVKTNALLSAFEEKSMNLEKKLHVADAKLEEVNRKSFDLERKLQEVETRDSLLQRERISFIADREAREATFSMQNNDLQEWQRLLQNEEERLCEGRRITAEREVKVNETEMALKLKDQELTKVQKEINLSTSVLKRKEDDINRRLANLTAQEHKAETLRSDLKMKENELLALTEKLSARERVEIQMLLDEQCAALNAKMQEFEVEMDGKRKSFNEEKRSRLDALQNNEDEITHRVEKLGKLELSLVNKSERIKETEKELEAKLRTLKEKENLLKSDEKRLDLEKKQMLIDKDFLQAFKDEIEKTGTDISQRERKIQEEIEKLKVSEEERAEYIRLQLELKEAIKKCRFEKDLLLKEHENIKDMKNFEEKWEMLYESKREELEAHTSEREREFVEERERENKNINYLKEAAPKDMEESRPKRRRIEKDGQEISLNKKQLEENQLEKLKDINKLEVLGKEVRVEREQFIKERERFLLFSLSQVIDSEKDQDLSTEGDVKVKTSKTCDKSIEAVITENIELNEEVNSMIPECSNENGRGSTLLEDGDNEFEASSEDEDLDDESEGEVSIHRKLWTFLIT